MAGSVGSIGAREKCMHSNGFPLYEQGFKPWPFRSKSGTPTHGNRGGGTSIPWATELPLEQVGIKGTSSQL